jgi:imidazolonepropionase-like amidohydrolase
MIRIRLTSPLLTCLAFTALAQAPPPAPAVTKYLKVNTPVVVLNHVRLIDGTGAPALEDQALTIESGKITRIEPASTLKPPATATLLDLTGRTIMPGIVGMHDHMYYIARPNRSSEGPGDPPLIVPQMSFSAPRLYLAAGVTTLRTTGSVEPYTDLNLRTQIDAGQLPGPHMDVTGPYLEGSPSPFLQMHNLRDPADATATVAFWAAQGVTSFKAYMDITRAELKAAIDEAHKRHIKVTGHLCSVTYPEAAELGIDNLEHGFYVNTQLDPGKQPDLCPETMGAPTLTKMTSGSPEAKALIDLLIAHHVAVTSTLPVFESDDPFHVHLQTRVLETMSPSARQDYLTVRNLEMMRATANPQAAADHLKLLQNEMALERQFVAAGGLLLAGPDPTGDGGVLPGFGDQREIELLVQAGFSPLEAIRIATLNGAIYLDQQAHIGSLAPGKNADIVVVKGDPSTHIADIENVEIVFKDGVGYDSPKLFESVKGRFGQY